MAIQQAQGGNMEESWGVTGTHKKAEVLWQAGGTWRNRWYHGMDQGDTQGAGNAAPGALGHSGSITGRG